MGDLIVCSDDINTYSGVVGLGEGEGVWGLVVNGRTINRLMQLVDRLTLSAQVGKPDR